MVYRFSSERNGQIVMTQMQPSMLVALKNSDEFILNCEFDFSNIPELAVAELAVNSSVIIKNQDSNIEYWSLVHTQSKPDFHRSSHRIWTLSEGEQK